MAHYLVWARDDSGWDDGGFAIFTSPSGSGGYIFQTTFAGGSNIWGNTINCYSGATITGNSDGTISVVYTLSGTVYNENYQDTYNSVGSRDIYLPQVETASATPITGVTLSSDSPVVGTELSAVASPSGATVTWQWSRGASPISGATSASYTPTADDVGSTLTATATGTGDYSGTATVTTTNNVRSAAPTGPVTESNNLKGTTTRDGLLTASVTPVADSTQTSDWIDLGPISKIGLRTERFELWAETPALEAEQLPTNSAIQVYCPGKNQ